MTNSVMLVIVAVVCCYFVIVGFFLFEELLRQFLGASVSYYRPVTVILFGK